MRRPRRTPLPYAAAALLLLGVSACTTAAEAQRAIDATSGGGSGQCPFQADTETRGAVRLGYQLIPNGDLLVKNRKLLEACAPNVTISWLKFDSGADVVQGLGARSVDLSLVGSSPTTKALSAPLNLAVQVVWIHDVIGDAESLVARDKAVSDLAALKGRRIGVPFGSTAHYSLSVALGQAGLSSGDVQLINLSPDKILAAWQRGDIDATWIWDPTLAQTRKTGKIVMSSKDTAAKGAPTFDLATARSQFVAENPGFLKVWTRAQDYAVKQIRSDPEGASESIAAELGIAPADVRSQLEGYTFLDAKQQAGSSYLGGRMTSYLSQTAKFLAGQGGVDAVAPTDTYAKGVYDTAAADVAGGAS